MLRLQRKPYRLSSGWHFRLTVLWCAVLSLIALRQAAHPVPGPRRASGPPPTTDPTTPLRSRRPPRLTRHRPRNPLRRRLCAGIPRTTDRLIESVGSGPRSRWRPRMASSPGPAGRHRNVPAVSSRRPTERNSPSPRLGAVPQPSPGDKAPNSGTFSTSPPARSRGSTSIGTRKG